jgi:pimeloyl-ACP methyl ester carboxylesterase
MERVTTLLLHGLGADRRQPLSLFGPLLNAGPGAEPGTGPGTGSPGGRILAPDLPAHGENPEAGVPAPAASDFALDRLADRVVAAVHSELGAPPSDDLPLTVIGISMGAAIALRILLRGLLPVRRAVFVRPAFTEEPLPANLRPFPVIGQLLADLGARDGEAAFRETSLYSGVARASPLGGHGLLSQFRSADAAVRAVRLVEIPRNRAFTGVGELTAAGQSGARIAVVGAFRDPTHPLSIAEQWADGLGAPLLRVPARDDGVREHTAAMRTVVGDWLAAT